LRKEKKCNLFIKKGLVLDWHFIAEKSLDKGIKKEQVEKISDLY
jgi:hypothetical protein